MKVKRMRREGCGFVCIRRGGDGGGDELMKWWSNHGVDRAMKHQTRGISTCLCISLVKGSSALMR